MVAIKVKVRLNDIWSVWIGPTLEGIRQDVRKLPGFYEPDTIEEIPIEVARQLGNYEVVASAIRFLSERHAVGGFPIGRLPEERR